MLFLYAITCGIVAAALAYAFNWWGLRAWRKAAGEHWTERARLLFPVRSVALGQIILLMLIAMFSGSWVLGPEYQPHWSVALLTWIGTVLATYPLAQEISPWLRFKPWWREVVLTWVLMLGWVGAYLVVFTCIPGKFSPEVWLWFSGFLIYLLYMNWRGLIPLLSLLGIVQPAPAALQQMVDRVAGRMQVKVRKVWLWQSSTANALAFPVTGDLLFSTRLLETMTEEEQEAICAHELGHLTESNSIVLVRIIGALGSAPLVLIRPMMDAYGLWGMLGLLFFWLGCQKLSKTIARKMEVRADATATDNSSGPVYARALEHLYEVNQMPAVMPGNNLVHPHLYDRLLAAGITPEYPRPQAPAKYHPITVLLWVIVMIAVTIHLFHR